MTDLTTLKEYLDKEINRSIYGKSMIIVVTKEQAKSVIKLIEENEEMEKEPKPFTEPEALKAGDHRVLINGRTIPVDYRVVWEDQYKALKKAYNKVNNIPDFATGGIVTGKCEPSQRGEDIIDVAERENMVKWCNNGFSEISHT